MPRALLSVSDKTGIIEFARALCDRGWTLISTGGTARALRDASIQVAEVSEITGHAEIMEGRVKTLHPSIHAGLLGRRAEPNDQQQMKSLGYEAIDLVAVNLYPFRETVARPGATLSDAIENIDIGGPAMLRSAAKNHVTVWVVVDPCDYARVLGGLDAADEPALELRRELATKVFRHTSEYDGSIARYLEDLGETSGDSEVLPRRVDLSLRRVQVLRYGENPGQGAAFYAEAGVGAPLEQLHGKELSFNNLLDVEAALFAISAWSDGELAACAIIKHNTPCGLAVAPEPAEAYRKALATDPTSAFGSVVAFNGRVGKGAADLLRGNFVEAVVAPSFDEGALDILRQKKNLRVLQPSRSPGGDSLDFKRVLGGFLVQQRMSTSFSEESWRVVTDRQPTESQWADLRFAWRAVAPVKSNAIVIARDGATLGIGAGQMSRVDSSRLAVIKAADNHFDVSGAALASDAFFPFRDGVDAAAAAGIAAIVQPGGSVRDQEVINAANERGLTMVFTGRRLFRH